MDESTFRIFYHGTTTDKRESIVRHGLIPGKDGLVYISPRLSVARKFGVERSAENGNPVVIYKIALPVNWVLEHPGKAFEMVSRRTIPYDLMWEMRKDESERITDWADQFCCSVCEAADSPAPAR